MNAPLLLLFALGRRVRALSIISQDRLADAASSAAEALDAIETVQAFGQEGGERARYRGALEAAFGASVKRIAARALMTAAVVAGLSEREARRTVDSAARVAR